MSIFTSTKIDYLTVLCPIDKTFEENYVKLQIIPKLLEHNAGLYIIRTRYVCLPKDTQIFEQKLPSVFFIDTHPPILRQTRGQKI
jgi:hypothetical protein